MGMNMSIFEPTVASEQISLEKHSHLIEEVIIISLIILSLIGIAIMNFSPSEGYWYWVLMTPVFGVAAMIISFLQTKRGHHATRQILVEQSLLWFGVLLGLCGTLSILHAGVLDDGNTGLVLLLILSLATYIDGLRIGWRFALVGNFLGLTAVLIAFLENFMWLLYGFAAITIGLTIYLDKHRIKWTS